MNRILAAAVFLVCAAAGARRACPTVYQDDSPETVTAAVTLGIAHPPGDAAVALLGRLACLVPAGSPAFRMNLLAGWLLAAFAAGLALAARATDAAGRLAAGVTAAGLTLTVPVLVRFGADAKGVTYGLNLCLLLTAGCALRAYRWPAAALATGAMLGHHWMTAVLYLGAWAAAAALLTKPSRRAMAMATALLLPGLGLLIVLPIRSAGGAELDWGGTQAAGAFLHHLARTAFLQTELNPGASMIVTQLLAMGRALAWALGPAGAVLAVLAIRRLDLATLRGRLSFGLVALAPPAAMAVYFAIPSERGYLYDAFLLPTWLLAAAGATAAAAAIARRPRPAAALVLLLVVHVVVQAPDLRRHSLATATWSFDLGRALLRSAPPGAGLALSSDLDIFPVWHAQRVLGEHPVIPVKIEILRRHAWYRRANPWLETGPQRRWMGPTAEGFAHRRFLRAFPWRGYFEAAGRRPEPHADLALGYTNELLARLR